jgi:hypothetical protein
MLYRLKLMVVADEGGGEAVEHGAEVVEGEEGGVLPGQ